jgi:hypothetical protein
MSMALHPLRTFTHHKPQKIGKTRDTITITAMIGSAVAVRTASRPNLIGSAAVANDAAESKAGDGRGSHGAFAETRRMGCQSNAIEIGGIIEIPCRARRSACIAGALANLGMGSALLR